MKIAWDLGFPQPSFSFWERRYEWASRAYDAEQLGRSPPEDFIPSDNEDDGATGEAPKEAADEPKGPEDQNKDPQAEE